MEVAISLGSLIVAILSLAWTIYKDTSLSNNSNGTTNIKIDNSNNATNTTINNKNTTTINNKNTTNNNNTTNINKTYKDESQGNEFIIFFIIFIIGSTLYSKYSNTIIIITSVVGVLSLISTLICYLVLLRKRLLSNKNYIYSFIKYIVLFTCIIFVSKPLYNSDIVSIVENLLKNDSGFINVFTSYPSGMISISCKIAAVGIIVAQFIMYFKLIIVTYKSCKNNIPMPALTLKDIMADIIIFVILLLVSTGYFVKIFDTLQSIKI